MGTRRIEYIIPAIYTAILRPRGKRTARSGDADPSAVPINAIVGRRREGRERNALGPTGKTSYSDISTCDRLHSLRRDRTVPRVAAALVMIFVPSSPRTFRPGVPRSFGVPEGVRNNNTIIVSCIVHPRRVAPYHFYRFPVAHLRALSFRVFFFHFICPQRCVN